MSGCCPDTVIKNILFNFPYGLSLLIFFYEHVNRLEMDTETHSIPIGIQNIKIEEISL